MKCLFNTRELGYCHSESVDCGERFDNAEFLNKENTINKVQYHRQDKDQEHKCSLHHLPPSSK